MDDQPNLGLSYFVYGLLQPGEIAHAQVESFLKSEPVEDEVQGTLYARDGLPLLVTGEGCKTVRGYLLRFAEEQAEEAYAKISHFEPVKHYRWDTVRLPRSGEKANVLVGKSPEKGSIRVEEGVWRGERDPLLTSGLSVVEEIADQYATERFRSAPPDSFEWERLFQIQMAYMFLWTCIERYAALAYGPGLGPNQKIKEFGKDPVFQRALRRTKVREDSVYKSTNPSDRADLKPDDGVKSADYYYYVRSNITHRGKAAYSDGEKVRMSLLELLKIFDAMLDEQVSGRENTY